MSAPSLQSILCPTDFSAASVPAFLHGLRIAVGAKSQLHLLNVARRQTVDPPPIPFPRARGVLIKWGLLDARATTGAVLALGVRVIPAQVQGYDVSAQIARYAKAHACELVVVATHARRGLSRWKYGSIASESARRTLIPTLYLHLGARGFVDADTGAVSLKRVLIPVDPAASPSPAKRLVEALAGALQSPVEIKLLSVGRGFDPGAGWPPVEVRDGPVAETIVDYAREIGADLILLPTIGRRGLSDALFGSTTERVVMAAEQPVLTVPVGKS